jgi:hypothetical protein
MRLTETIKGYRPGRLGLEAEPTTEALRAKELSIELYARLVRRGFVLFEDTPPSAVIAERQAAGLM